MNGKIRPTKSPASVSRITGNETLSPQQRLRRQDVPATVVVATVIATLVTAVGLHADGRARAAAGALAVIAAGRGRAVRGVFCRWWQCWWWWWWWWWKVRWRGESSGKSSVREVAFQADAGQLLSKGGRGGRETEDRGEPRRAEAETEAQRGPEDERDVRMAATAVRSGTAVERDEAERARDESRDCPALSPS